MTTYDDRLFPALSRLRDELRGRLVMPTDPDYDEVRIVFAGAVDRRPAAIAKVEDARDVSRVIAFAREEGLELAVRSGGHSGAGHGATEGGIVIDVRGLRELDIDVDEPDGLGRLGPDGARVHRGRVRARARDRLRRHGLGRPRRAHPRRRRRLPRPQARPDDRFPAGGGDRDGRRLDPARSTRPTTPTSSGRSAEAAATSGSSPASSSGSSRSTASSAGCSCCPPRPRRSPASSPRQRPHPWSSRRSPTS